MNKSIEIMINEHIFEDEQLNKIIFSRLNNSNITKTIYHLIKNVYKYTYVTNWYRFVNNRWIIDNNIELIILKDIVNNYEKIENLIGHIDKEDKYFINNKLIEKSIKLPFIFYN